MGRKVAFTVGAGAADGYLAVPEAGIGPGVVVIGETWSLTGHTGSVVDRFAAEGFVAIAPDLYHAASGSAPPNEHLLTVGRQHAINDVSAAVRFLGQLEECTGQIAAVGFAAGGCLALAAGAEVDLVRAVASYYPRQECILDGLPTGAVAPVPWQRFRSKAVVIHRPAGQDGAIEALRRRITEAGGSCHVYDYPAAAPDFFNDDRPEAYHPDAARTAWARTLELLRSTLVAQAA